MPGSKICSLDRSVSEGCRQRGGPRKWEAAGCSSTPLSRASVDRDRQGAALPCDTWSEPQQLGMLDHQIIPEASGIAVSRAFEDRLYHNNDSGDGPYFYVTNGAGEATQTVTVGDFEPSDVEAMAQRHQGLVVDSGSTSRKAAQTRAGYQ